MEGRRAKELTADVAFPPFSLKPCSFFFLSVVANTDDSWQLLKTKYRYFWEAFYESKKKKQKKKLKKKEQKERQSVVAKRSS